jgi:hypothetical protein
MFPSALSERTLLHTMYMPGEFYHKDFENVRKRRFKTKKEEMEQAVRMRVNVLCETVN